MSNNIGWTDKTANPIVGCTPISPGCANCWAASDTWIRQHNPTSPHYQAGLTKAPGVWSGRISFRPEVLDQIRTIKKPQRIFMPSMSDLFHPAVKLEWLIEIFKCVRDCPHITFQMLTKRPQSMVDWFCDSDFAKEPPLDNLWLGTSIENQETANYRCRWLRSLARIGYTTFLSIEPLLNEIDLVEAGVIKPYSLNEQSQHQEYEKFVSWAIIGGESGHSARPCSPDWIGAIAQQCQVVGVAVYVKQLGTFWAKQSGTYRVDTKGSNPEVWPEVLRMREFPNAIAQVSEVKQ